MYHFLLFILLDGMHLSHGQLKIVFTIKGFEKQFKALLSLVAMKCNC